MAKEVAISKRVKITQAQEYMILAVLVAALILGAAIALVINFTKKIAFNAQVIAAEEASVADYSEVIESIGICTKPKGDIYTEEELKKCDPDSIDVDQVPGTLRANILTNLAANQALNSVPKEADSNCINPETGKNYTYAELNKIYDEASGDSLASAANLIKTCSALRVIPDALPAYKNEEALLSSLNKIFIVSGWEPESLSPSGDSSTTSGSTLHTLSVSLAIEANSETVMTVLNNIERSIREFNFESASIEWSKNNTLNLTARASAYYTETSTLKETIKTIKAEGTKK